MGSKVKRRPSVFPVIQGARQPQGTVYWRARRLAVAGSHDWAEEGRTGLCTDVPSSDALRIKIGLVCI